MLTLSQEGRTQTLHCNHSHCGERRAVEMEKRRSEGRKVRKEGRKKGRSVIEYTTKCDVNTTTEYPKEHLRTSCVKV